MSTPKPIRILIVGTGSMAAYHVEAFKKIPNVEIVGGVDVRAEQLAAFNEKHGIANGFASVEEAITWGQFDAASNVTPDRFHYPTTLSLLAAGKHVLCEKPLATNAAHALEMAEAAAKAGVVNAVHFSYRRGAALQRAAELVSEGAIGEVRFFEASYLQNWLHQEWQTRPECLWRLSTAHGSRGALGDTGVHIVDFTTYVAGQAVTSVSGLLTTYDKAPEGKVGDYVLDANDSATMQLKLANGAVGTITTTRVASGHGNDLRLRIYGTKGGLEVSDKDGVSQMRACIGADMETSEWRVVDCPAITPIHERFIAAIRGEKTPLPPNFARGAEVQRVLDAAEESAAKGSQIITL